MKILTQLIICLQEFSLSIRYFIVNNLFFPSALQEPFASPWHCTTCSLNSPHVPPPVATAAQLDPVPLLVRQWGNGREEIRRCSCALINVFRHPLWDLDESKYNYFSFRVVFFKHNTISYQNNIKLEVHLLLVDLNLEIIKDTFQGGWNSDEKSLKCADNSWNELVSREFVQSANCAIYPSAKGEPLTCPVISHFKLCN